MKWETNLKNTIVTSYKLHERFKKDLVPEEQMSNITKTIGDFKGFQIIANKYCPENYGYVFDGEGNLTIILDFN